MPVNTTYSNGTAIYSLMEKGKEIGQIRIKDGTYPGYSIVPVITDLQGKSVGIIDLLNWMIIKTKSPLLAEIKYPLLLDYGFKHFETGLVWDGNVEEVEVLQAVHA